MSSEKSNPEYNVEIVPYRPYYRRLLFLVSVVAGLVLVISSFYFGHRYGMVTEQSAVVERDQLQSANQEKEQTIQALEQRVANLTLGSKVDRKATQEVQSQVVQLKNRIAELEQDNTFYRDLMRPGSRDQGISISAPTVTLLNAPLNSPKTYEYKLVIKQLATSHSQIIGHLEFVLVGREDDKERRIPLKELSNVVSSNRIKLNFKYFQQIKGEMVLPERFEPKLIELKAVSKRPKRAVVEKQFSWTAKES